MRHTLIAPAGGAGLAAIGAAGPSSAQTNAPDPRDQGQGWAPTASPLLDETVTDPDGQPIGEIVALTEDALMVRVGRYLGVGARVVRIPRSHVWTDKVGSVTKIEARLTREQIESLPELEGPPEAP